MNNKILTTYLTCLNTCLSICLCICFLCRMMMIFFNYLSNCIYFYSTFMCFYRGVSIYPRWTNNFYLYKMMKICYLFQKMNNFFICKKISICSLFMNSSIYFIFILTNFCLFKLIFIK